MRDYRLYLKDILSAMDSIQAFVEGMNFDDFSSDQRRHCSLSAGLMAPNHSK
jgi:uncharacterized protein with HEPN domain